MKNSGISQLNSKLSGRWSIKSYKQIVGIQSIVRNGFGKIEKIENVKLSFPVNCKISAKDFPKARMKNLLVKKCLQKLENYLKMT